MKLLAIIPARGGSKGVPRKNIRLLGGKPLIWYSFEAARASNLFQDIILSTEDQEIADIGRELGISVPFIRPKELSEDDTKSISVVQHALTVLENKGFQYDAVALLQPTSPFRRKNLITEARDIMLSRDADSIISVRVVPHKYNPHWVFVPDNENYLNISTGEKEIISRRQNLPTTYYRDGQLYITSTKVIKTLNSFMGNKVAYIVNNDPGSGINIDTENDWQEAESFIEKINRNK